MKTDLKNKRKITITIIALIVVGIVVLLFGTYAWWTTTKKQTNRNLIGSACLDITFSNETGDISLNDAWPTTDSDGAALTPYTFRITNNCNTAVTYEIALESIEAEGQDNPSYLNYNYIKIKLDDGRPAIYGNLEGLTNDTEKDYTIRDTKQIGINTLSGHEHADHELRIWLDENTPIEEINKIFISKIKVIGGQGIAPDECYTIKSDGTITGYNPECGTSATIPATVNGIRVRSIATDAFRTYSATYNATLEDYEADAGKQSDFSIFFNRNLIPLFGIDVPEKQTQAALASATKDDIWIVINHAPLTAEKQAALNNAIAAAFDALNATQILTALNFQPTDFTIYTKGSDTLPSESKGVVETIFEIAISGENVNSNLIGIKQPSIITERLAINSLDLSQTTYLERIERRAFSNVPANPTNIDYLPNTPVGLTSLTFGNHTNPIHIGFAAFAFSDLDSLTIYNSYTFEQLSDNIDVIAFLGPFGQSTIDNLTIKKAGNNNSYSTMDIESIFNVFDVEEDNWGSALGNALGIMIALAFPAVTTNNVVFDNGITNIGYTAFQVNNQLTLPNDLQTLGRGSFMLTHNYSGTLTLPSTLTTIGDGAFGNFTSSNGITIPSSVTTIGEGAFQNYVGPSITFAQGSVLTSIGVQAFNDYNGSSITLPSTINTIGEKAFYSMDDSKTITVNRAEQGMTLGENWNGNAVKQFIN